MTATVRSVRLSGPEVRAVLAGERRPILRRIEGPVISEPMVGVCRVDFGDSGFWQGSIDDARYIAEFVACPFWAPGARLWVQESWRSWEQRCDSFDHDEDEPCTPHCHQVYVAYEATPRLGYRPVPDKARITYLDDSTPVERDPHLLGPWNPASEMPRWASRLTLEVTNVRAERARARDEFIWALAIHYRRIIGARTS